jgi:hypothetical protein
MPALIVSSSILGTTMGRTFSAVPYTYLKRGVYYFVIAMFSLQASLTSGANWNTKTSDQKVKSQPTVDKWYESVWGQNNIPEKLALSLSAVGLNSIANWTGCRASGSAGDPQYLAEQILSDGWSHLSFPICVDNYFTPDWDLKDDLVIRKARAMRKQILALNEKFPNKAFVVIAKSRDWVGGWSRNKVNSTLVYEAFETNQKARESYYQLWKIWAEELKDVPEDSLAFGIMNEPEFHKRGFGAADRWAEYAKEIIGAIRAVSPDRVILFEGVNKSVVGRGNSPSSMSKILPFDRIIYGFHFYEPYDWTHRKGKGGKEPSIGILQKAKSTMTSLQNFSERHNVPVMLSEVGVWGPSFNAKGEIIQGVSFEERAKFADVIYQNTVPFNIGVTWWAVHDQTTPYGGSCCKMQNVLNPDPALWSALRLPPPEFK